MKFKPSEILARVFAAFGLLGAMATQAKAQSNPYQNPNNASILNAFRSAGGINSLPGLLGRYKADIPPGSNGVWPDQSGKNNHAVPQDLFKVPQIVTVNGRSMLNFNGTQMLLASLINKDVIDRYGPATVFMSVQLPSTGTDPTCNSTAPFNTMLALGPYITATNGGKFDLVQSCSSPGQFYSASYANLASANARTIGGNTVVIAQRIDGGQIHSPITTYLDTLAVGTQDGLAPNVNYGSAQYLLTIGNDLRDTSNRGLIGQVRQVVVFNTRLTDQQMNQVTLDLADDAGLLGTSSPPPSQNALTITPAASATRGGTVPLTLALTTAAGGVQPSAFQFAINYPSANITGITVSSLVPDKTLSCGTSPGFLKCVDFGFNKTTIANASVAQLLLTFSPNAPDTSVTLQFSDVEGATPNGGGFFIAPPVNATITLPPLGPPAMVSPSILTTTLSPPVTGQPQGVYVAFVAPSNWADGTPIMNGDIINYNIYASVDETEITKFTNAGGMTAAGITTYTAGAATPLARYTADAPPPTSGPSYGRWPDQFGGGHDCLMDPAATIPSVVTVNGAKMLTFDGTQMCSVPTINSTNVGRNDAMTVFATGYLPASGTDMSCNSPESLFNVFGAMGVHRTSGTNDGKFGFFQTCDTAVNSPKLGRIFTAANGTGDATSSVMIGGRTTVIAQSMGSGISGQVNTQYNLAPAPVLIGRSPDVNVGIPQYQLAIGGDLYAWDRRLIGNVREFTVIKGAMTPQQMSVISAYQAKNAGITPLSLRVNWAVEPNAAPILPPATASACAADSSCINQGTAAISATCANMFPARHEINLRCFGPISLPTGLRGLTDNFFVTVTPKADLDGTPGKESSPPSNIVNVLVP